VNTRGSSNTITSPIKLSYNTGGQPTGHHYNEQSKADNITAGIYSLTNNNQTHHHSNEKMVSSQILASSQVMQSNHGAQSM
jgi:hypothetical protein